MGERAAYHNRLERSTANSDALILFRVQDVSRPSTDFCYPRLDSWSLLRWYLELVNAAAQAFLVCCHNSNFLASLAVWPACIAHESVEAQGIRTLLARPLRDHNGTLGTLD